MSRREPPGPPAVNLLMGEGPDEPAKLDYAGPKTAAFPTGWRGCVGAVAIMLAVAGLLVAMVFAFSFLVRITRG